MTDAWKIVTEEFETDGETDALRVVTDRLAVPGGWLYRVTRFNASHSADFDMPDVVAVTYVPMASDGAATG